ncbi:hypothetical protein CVT25_003005 [Psilocybe cyanescens]|uniref:Uncharacterized protein n=1 Tax=Psilocybe cyanescens TaxID=93625 RepID=A0A409WN95_PSICY|nr:hypothetical protein CVT25_003005 [Psilocybe cyanescens]
MHKVRVNVMVGRVDGGGPRVWGVTSIDLVCNTHTFYFLLLCASAAQHVRNAIDARTFELTPSPITSSAPRVLAFRLTNRP